MSEAGWFTNAWNILARNPVTRRIGYGAAIGAGANAVYGGYFQGRGYLDSAMSGALMGAIGGAAYAGYLGAGERLIGGRAAESLGEAWRFSKGMQELYHNEGASSIKAAGKAAMRNASLSARYIGSYLNQAYNAIKVL